MQRAGGGAIGPAEGLASPAAAPPSTPLPPPPSARRRSRRSASLPGHASQPFIVRFNLTALPADRMLDWIALLLTPLGIVRFWPWMTTPGLWAWMGFQLLLPLANMLWRHVSQGKTDGGCYLRLRELSSAAARATAMGFGAAWVVARAALENEAMAGPRARALGKGLLNFFNASAVPYMLLGWLKPMRFGWAPPLHLAFNLWDATYARQMCSLPGLLILELKPPLHRAYRLLDLLRYTLHPILVRPPAQPRQGAEGECATVMAFLQLTVGLAIPAALKAAHEARLFALHQRQRRQLRLPPEQNWHARIYRAAGSLLAPAPRTVSSVMFALPAWLLLLGLLWDAALFLGSL